MTTDDFVKILCPEPTTTIEDITKMFRVQAKKYHPDLNKSADAPALFINLVKAYELLLAGTRPIVEKIKTATKPKVDPNKPVDIFRVADIVYRSNIEIRLPYKEIVTDKVCLHLMLNDERDSKEFRMMIQRGTILPWATTLYNYKRPINITMRSE